MKKDFKNEIVSSQYKKFINNVMNDTHSAYLAWMNTLELFDAYVDEVKRCLDDRSIEELPKA